ncbi:unnamed protein product [Caenorhabditis angaria]|uniref:Uncharacterized protein n=1 Tax=Caenorhabditis angaria TaxID=860376 RepID=A0A9P1N886_9PELO|nr:unnamed protein product [Caenorhabditis angaria]
MLFSFMILFLLFQVSISLPIVADQKSWIDDRLCVLKMGSTCPSGFEEDNIKLSVQTDVNPRDTDINGDRLIKMGKAGETSLTRDTYDSVYTLTLVTCCK